MEQENPETSMMLSRQPSARLQKLKDLIEEWIPRFAINAGHALDFATQKTYAALWLEGLGDLSPEVLHAAFIQTLRECSYWPVKVSDIRKHVTHASKNAEEEKADRAWEHALDLRRVYWNPDIPGPLERALDRLSERFRQAARASGVFREFTATEFENGALHTWAKKTFIESYLRYGELQQDKFLLPDGDVKNAIANLAKIKSLPE